jgi:hypothetical protein
LVKPAGKILTLTADEAVTCGLAIGISEDVSGCDVPLGIKDLKEGSRRGIAAYVAHQNAVEDAASRYRAALKTASDEFDRADAHDPTKHEYLVDETGTFTEEARREWQKHSDNSARALRFAEGSLNVARGIVTKYPQIRYHPKLADKAMSPQGLAKVAGDVSLLVERIRLDRQRKGIAVK